MMIIIAGMIWVVIHLKIGLRFYDIMEMLIFFPSSRNPLKNWSSFLLWMFFIGVADIVGRNPLKNWSSFLPKPMKEELFFHAVVIHLKIGLRFYEEADAAREAVSS